MHVGDRLQLLDQATWLTRWVHFSLAGNRVAKDRLHRCCALGDRVRIDDACGFASSLVGVAVGLQCAANVKIQPPTFSAIGIDTIQTDCPDLAELGFDDHTDFGILAFLSHYQSSTNRRQR